MARLIELLSTRKNSRKKSTVCYFKNFIEKFEFGSRVFRRSVSLPFPVLLFPLFYYSLFHESLHKKMRLTQNVDSTLQNIDGNFRVTRIEAFPSQVFGHCPRICSPPYRINPTTSPTLPKSKTLSARCFAVAGPFVVRFKHGNSINQESANF